MEFKFIKSLLIGFALSCGLSASAQDMTGKKFYVGVTSNGTTVSATVYDDYGFMVQLPSNDADVDVSEFTVNTKMHNVITLGLSEGELRSATATVKTGAAPGKTKLSASMPNSFSFSGVTSCINVIDNEGSKSFHYNIAEINGNNQIIGTAASTEDARAAWQKIASHVYNKDDANGDSKIIVMPGTHIIMGGECIEFENTEALEICEGNWSISGTIEAIKDAANIYSVSDIPSNIIKVYLPAESSLYIGESNATLKDAATITLDLSKAYNDLSEQKILSTLKNAAELSKAEAMQSFIQAFDMVVGAIKEAGEVAIIPITVDFKSDPIGSHKPEAISLTVYKGNKTAETGISLEAFKTIQESYPNAIAIADVKYADIISSEVENNGLTNVIVGYPSGKNGTYYECENLILTDRKSGTNCSYYSPVNFYAVKGKYTRTLTLKNNTCAVPFALSKSDFSSEVDVLTLAYIEPAYYNNEYHKDEAWVYFNSKSAINAGVPCFIYNRNQSSTIMSKDFDNTYIVGEPDNSVNIHGFYMTTTLANPEKYLGPDSEDRQLGYYTSANTGNPFRSAIYYSYDKEFNDGNNHHTESTLAKSFDIFIIKEDGEITSLDGVVIDNSIKKDKIHTIDGRQISNITKSGFYIINGKKVFVK